MISYVRSAVVFCTIFFCSLALAGNHSEAESQSGNDTVEEPNCSGVACTNKYITCNEGRCINEKTNGWGPISFTPVFENQYEIDLLHISMSCETEATEKKTLPKNSFFRQTLDYEAQTPNETIVHVYDVDEEFKDLLTIDPEANGSAQKFGFFDTPFKLCRNGVNRVSPSLYKRVGGVNTGLLVVPFKVRQGDIFSDSAIGPYISYQWAVIEVLATGGLSQISVSEVGTDEVENKTGLTYALGINFEIDTNWDIALIAGRDRLSGSDGDDWKYQDKWWWSFAIGYNFTQ